MKHHRPRVLLPIVSVLATATLATAQITQPSGRTGCRVVSGLPSIGTTDDDGGTWATNDRPMRVGEGTFGLAAVGRGSIVAEHRGRIYVSRNDGCNWRPLGPTGGGPLQLVGGTNVAYGWSFFSEPNVWRIDLGAHGAAAVQQVSSIPDDVIAIGIDPADDMHVRALGRRGGLYESFDGGTSKWGLAGSAPVTPLVYFGTFDPNDLDHLIVGMITNGVVTTHDGGRSWSTAAGLTQTGGSRNSFSGSISSVDGSMVWVESIDLDESSAGAPSGGKHIYLSGDGGLTFTPVVDAGNGVVLQNGIPLALDPFDANVVYFAFGTTVFGNRIELFRYDFATGKLTSTVTTTTPHAKVRALVLSPTLAGRIIAGFEG